MPDCIKQNIQLERLRGGSYNGIGLGESLEWGMPSAEAAAQVDGDGRVMQVIPEYPGGW